MSSATKTAGLVVAGLATAWSLDASAAVTQGVTVTTDQQFNQAYLVHTSNTSVSNYTPDPVTQPNTTAPAVHMQDSGIVPTTISTIGNDPPSYFLQAQVPQVDSSILSLGLIGLTGPADNQQVVVAVPTNTAPNWGTVFGTTTQYGDVVNALQSGDGVSLANLLGVIQKPVPGGYTADNNLTGGPSLIDWQLDGFLYNPGTTPTGDTIPKQMGFYTYTFAADQSVAQSGTGIVAVPEPTGLTLLVLPAVALLRRQRRTHTAAA